MMDDILKQINAGEVSGVQFKERILDKYDIACELVAFRIFLFNMPYTCCHTQVWAVASLVHWTKISMSRL